MSPRLRSFSTLFSLALGLLATLTSAQQEWTPIEDPNELVELMSGVVMEAPLPGGNKAVGRYNADGTGVLEAWGDRFPRTWSVTGQNLVRVVSGTQIDHYRIERNNVDAGRLRVTNLVSGEAQVVAVQGSGSTTKMIRQAPVEGAGPEAGAPAEQGQSGGAASPTAEEIAAELANPNTPLASLTVQLQFRTFQGSLPGAHEENGFTVLFQPSFPFPLENGDTVFFRPAIPILVDQPVFDAGGGNFDSEFGLGDIAFDLAYGRTTKSGMIFAAGLVSSLPTATDETLGTDRLTLGPEFLLGKLSEKSVLGIFPSHQWDIGGSGDRDVSLTNIQAFGTYLPGDGWNVGTAPIMSFDHEADQWTLPLNFTFGKTVLWKGRPWRLSLGLNYYLDQPDPLGPEWMVQVNIAPVVENVFASWFE